MSVATHTPDGPSELPAIPVWRLSVDQYHEMLRAGILTEDDPVELLDGWLVTMTPKNPPHHLATELAREALEHLTPEGWHVDSQEPITLSSSEPEPDVAVVRGARRLYADRHPQPSDIGLVVEVADDSLERDQTFKQRLYAQAGIPEYWIVNLVDRRLEVYREPSGPGEKPGYRQHRSHAPSEEVALSLDDRVAARFLVSILFP